MIYKIGNRFTNVADSLGHYSYTCKVLGRNHDYTNRFNDSDLNRVITHTKEGMMIVSAERPIGVYPEENETTTPEEHAENVLERSDRLEKDIRNKGLGFISTFGGWPNNKTGEMEEELSYIVPFKSSQISEEEFYNFAIELCKKYLQVEVLVILPNLTDGKPIYVDSNTILNKATIEEENLGRFGTGKTEKGYYTRLKKGKENNTFAYERRPDIKIPASKVDLIAKSNKDIEELKARKGITFETKESLYDALSKRYYRVCSGMSSVVGASHNGEIMR